MANTNENSTQSKPLERAGYREADWCAEAGIGRTKMWELVKSGEVKVKRSGRCTIIVTSPRQWLDSLPGHTA
jgi:hypothetical protein